MNYKLKMISTFLLLSFCLLKAQNNKIYYNLNFIKDTITKVYDEKNMVTWVQKENIIFYSESLMERDSLYNIDKKKVYFSPEDIEFTVNKQANKINRFFLIDQKLFSIESNTLNLDWKINSQKKFINDMPCQMATLNYGGRTWEAWFTKDYILPYGPYVFQGLPGLIVELYDTKKNYIFSLIKIRNESKNISESIFSSPYTEFSKPIVVTKIQLNKLYKSFYSSPYKRMKEKGVIEMFDEKTGVNEPSPDFDKMSRATQKYIRENNNPIEISDAVKY